MRHIFAPNIGNWYKNQGINNIFEVVATDDDGSVEIQYFSGEIEELDLDTWYDLDLRQIPPPEDWSGPFEMTKDELGYTDEAYQPEDWNGPLTDLEPEDYY